MRDQITIHNQITIHTGIGGYDLFQEILEGEFGIKRVHMGRKVPRFIRVLKTKIHKSASGRYYKKIFPKVTL